MNKYFKRNWNERRGDEYSSWGASVWFFEVNIGGFPVRQIQLYENGNRLRYDSIKMFDDYGGLGDQSLDLNEFKELEINKEGFEQEWIKVNLKKVHQEIINLISDYLANHYDQRFGQALFNLGINEFTNKADPSKDDYRVRDIHSDSDEQIFSRINSQLEWFEERRRNR